MGLCGGRPVGLVWLADGGGGGGGLCGGRSVWGWCVWLTVAGVVGACVAVGLWGWCGWLMGPLWLVWLGVCVAGVAGGVCFAILCGKDRFDRFGMWPSNQRYNRFGLRYTPVCDKSFVETAMTSKNRAILQSDIPKVYYSI